LLLKDNINKHEIFNVACGNQFSLNNVIKLLQNYSNINTEPIYGEDRQGDIKHSKASIEKIMKFCGYNPRINFEEGLKISLRYYADRDQ